MTSSLIPSSSGTLHSLATSTSTPTSNPLIPALFATPAPIPPRAPGCNRVVIQLTTTVRIPDYSRYYPDIPIRQFYPNYTALEDGSLATDVLLKDVAGASIAVLFSGIFLMLFARNIFIAGDYIRRAKLKKKVLFYLLFLSQLLAIVALVPIILSQFHTSAVDCTVVNIVATVATITSLHILITCILGYKAYRCLKDSVYVIILLGFFLCSSIAVTILELNTMRAERRLIGGCQRTSSFRWITVYIVIQLVESFSILMLFVFAVWKTSRSSSGAGRLSLRNSNADRSYHIQTLRPPESGSSEPRHHWWFRFVPERVLPRRADVTEEPNDPKTNSSPLPAQSLQALPPSTIRVSVPEECSLSGTGRTSPAPSTLSRLIPRMELFRQVLRDELCYTTFITASCTCVAIACLLGLNFENPIPVLCWVSMNWALISMLAISSFGRVIVRQERDAILQEPLTWQRTRNPLSPLQFRSQPSVSPSIGPSMVSRRRPWEKSPADDGGSPFSDSRRLTDSRGSWDPSYYAAPESLSHYSFTSTDSLSLPYAVDNMSGPHSMSPGDSFTQPTFSIQDEQSTPSSRS